MRKQAIVASAIGIVATLCTPLAPTSASGAVVPTAAVDFYTPPSPLPDGRHGSLIRSAPSSVLTAPLATARKIMYLSQDTRGRAVAMTGTVIVPNLPWPGNGHRPLVAFGIGTIGLADKCAPSKLLTGPVEYEGAPIGAFVLRGYSVVVPDYQGLGTPGTHPYLNRAALAHAVLDSVRAARQLPNVDRAGPIGLIGYSEGGDSTAAAAELAGSYTPELKIKGAAVGSAPADLVALVNFLDGLHGAGFIGYVLAGLSAAYPNQIKWGGYLNPAGMRLVASVQDECLWETLPHTC